ncbi:very-short-patch-repair endonuclease [Microvirga flocculans]|uniref:Very-short-patch-repair endonuclease n=1 Tax=Microvirga flocculans TaxID=217168 RepID=A0A7W6N807_9HYPH|nr:endonuclease domain-containing protein [Microvirga flocculans]MBB4040202.1 very-short-patch-repair endonuclease [Microvirga flocculans]
MPSTRKIGTSRSRALRRNATDAEKALWRALKNIPVYGSHFRRQVPLGPYVADFACLKARLIIELDGGQHAEDEVAARDEHRTRWLESEGYRVMRFWNAELSKNMPGVLDTIYAGLYGSPQSEALALSTPPRPDGRPSLSRAG